MSQENSLSPIDWETALREFDNDKDFLLSLLGNFCTRFEQWHKEMGQMIKDNDEALNRQVHKLKGASGNLFTQKLYQLASNWDEDLKNGNVNNSQEHLDKIHKEVKRLGQYIEEWSS